MVRPTVDSGLAIRDQMSIGPGVLSEPDDRTVKRNLWGISLVGLGLGLGIVGLVSGLFLSWAPGSSGAPVWAALGFYALMTRPRFFGRRHACSLAAGLVLAVLSVLVYAVLLGLPSSSAPADVLRSQLAASTAFVLLGCAAVYLALRGMMDRLENGIALAGLASALVVQAVIVLVVVSALGVTSASSLSLDRLQALWAQIGALNVIPLGLLIAAAELLYWRLHRRYLPNVSLWEA